MIHTTTPARYRNASLKKGEQNEITRIVSAMFSPEARKNKNDKACLVIIGIPGCGKTYAIWALKNDMDQLPEFIERGIDEEYHSYVNTSKRRVSVIDASWFTEYPFLPFEAKDDEIRRIKEADVLCIDDLGMETPGERNSALIESIINARYNDERTTIITSNLSSEQIKGRYSARIIDRLREWGVFFESKQRSYRDNHLKAVKSA